MEAQKKDRIKTIVGAVIVVICVIIGLNLLSGNKEPSVSRQTTSDTLGARTAARLFVRDRLKSPGSAKLGTISASSRGNSRYSFSGYVDSQNSFGANIRTRFSGVVRYNNGTWILESLSL